MNYLREYATKETPQTEAIPGSTQIENSAGGFSWAVDDWTRLRRFLILGSEGGSYYATQRKLTVENAEAIHRCIAQDGKRTVAEIVAVSKDGAAPKNDPAIFALALCAAANDDATRRAALDAIPEVCRIGTHLFHFAAYVEGFRGWGRGLRRAVARWYEREDAGQLAYQLVKYRQRDGWTHRDLLRLSHPDAPTDAHERLYDFACGRETAPADDLIDGYRAAQAAKTPRESAELIRRYGLPREAVTPDHLTDPEVWRALLEDMPQTALIRNLANLTRYGVIKPLSSELGAVCEQLTDRERLRKARVHPIALLSALATYQRGRGVRGSGEWTPVPDVVDALDAAFYLSFENVERTGKRHLLALDVSGSMTWGEIAGVPGLTPNTASAAMALVTASAGDPYMVFGFADTFRPLAISKGQRLDDAMRETQRHSFGGTDCSLPMLYAEQEGLEVDTFVVYTDSETRSGLMHPAQALARYRRSTGLDARLVVVAMVSNGFTIADPNDAGMLDVVGFDTATPRLMSEFAAGRL